MPKIHCSIFGPTRNHQFPPCSRRALVRFDTLLYQGLLDPALLRLDGWQADCSFQKTRELTIRKMKAALCELIIEGIDHTSQVHLDILCHPLFIAGDYYTDFMEHEFGKPLSE